MRKILILLALICKTTLFAQSGPPLDYSNYHKVFYDEFDYPNKSTPAPTNPLGTTVAGTTYYHNWKENDGDWGAPTYYDPSGAGVSLMTVGSKTIARFTESDISGAPVYIGSPPTARYHTSGMLVSQNLLFSYGILEASMKFPKDLSDSKQDACAALWTCCGYNEIDFPDVALWSDWLPCRLIDYHYGSTVSKGGTISSSFGDLSANFHTYSCKWSPSEVCYYIDSSMYATISYTEEKIFSQFYNQLELALETSNNTTGGQTMDIDWVKVWKQDCNGDSINLSAESFLHHTGTPLSFLFLDPGLYKHKIIASDAPTADLAHMPKTLPNNATILEAESTTLKPNFLSDESAVLTMTIPKYATFSYTGAVQTFFVPLGCTQMDIDIQGASGGNCGYDGVAGGKGGRVQCTIAVTPGQILYLYVGGAGQNGYTSYGTTNFGGYNGGGEAHDLGGAGGGASDIRTVLGSYGSRLVTAGGGGGAGGGASGSGCASNKGGDAGGPSGLDGEHCGLYNSSFSGAGGSVSGGGAGASNPPPAMPGSLGPGGNTPVAVSFSAGAGGGGYYGGGGANYGSGGGGSSYVNPASLMGKPTYTPGYSTGNGFIAINYDTTIIGNGYLEILPIICDAGDRDNTGKWYRKTDTSKHQHVNMPSNLNFNDATPVTVTDKSIPVNNSLTSCTQIQVYPNPTQDQINITYPCKSAGQLQISIKDVAGRELYTESVDCMEGNGVQHSIDFKSFVPGVYYIDLTLNDQHTVKKIVKL